MHIALVCRYLTAARGGHERYIKRLIMGLTGRGCSITAFSGAFDPEIESAAGMRCVGVPCVRYPQWARYLSFNRNARKAVASFGGEFDLVFSTEYVTFGDVYRAGAGFTRAEIDGYGNMLDRISLKNRIKMRLQAELMQKAAPHVIVNSRSMLRQCKRLFRLPPSRLSLVYNGIDTNKFPPENSAQLRSCMREKIGVGRDEFVCMTVGSNWKRKGVDRAVDVLRRVPDRRLKLLVIGDDSRIRHCFFRQKHRMIFVENTSAIENYYAAADLCVVASRYDPAPNVILESLACGVPVALSRECGLTELFEDDGCGAVFGDAVELAEVVRGFMDIRDSELYRTRQQNAIRLGQSFTMERHIGNILRVLQMVAEEKS